MGMMSGGQGGSEKIFFSDLQIAVISQTPVCTSFWPRTSSPQSVSVENPDHNVLKSLHPRGG